MLKYKYSNLSWRISNYYCSQLVGDYCVVEFLSKSIKLFQVSWEGSCEVPPNTRLQLFSFRTHTHGLGKVFSAYIVDGGTRSQWTLIGKANPSLPQVKLVLELMS